MVQSNTLYAPKTGLYLSGTSGNGAKAEYAQALEGFDIRVKIKLVNLTPASAQTIVAKYNATGTEREWQWEHTSSGTFRFLIWASSTASTVFTFTTPISEFLNVYSFTWVKITYDNAGTAYLYYQDLYAQWILVETATGTHRDTHASGGSLTVGADQDSLTFRVGNFSISNVEIREFDETLIAEADFSYPWANNKYTDATGKVWTISGSAWAWEYQDDSEDKYTPTPEIWGGDGYQLIDDQINNSSSALHILNGGNARGY